MTNQNKGDSITPNLTHAIKFYINEKQFETFQQYRNGAQLKELAEIPPDVPLYLKVQEGYEPELIENHKEVDLAHPGVEHFISKKKNHEVYLSINGLPRLWKEKTITYKEVVVLINQINPSAAEEAYSIVYFDGPPENPKGDLVSGESVFVTNNMIFNGTPTDKS